MTEDSKLSLVSHCNNKVEIMRSIDIIPPECAAQSVGSANHLFGLLIQMILAAHCNISPANMWPRDYGLEALEYGISQNNRK